MNGARALLEHDLRDILERNRDDFAELRGARVFVTGGSGFVGTWLLESLAFANTALDLGARVDVLTRDADAFAAASPHLARDHAIRLIRGDIRTLVASDITYDAVIHAATTASAKLNAEDPLVMLDTVVEGTRRALQVAARGGAIPFLFTSSGAVYGRQPPELLLVDESYAGAPDSLDVRNAYHESKRLAELLCAVYAQKGLRVKIGRLFAFVGPFLPLDRHFAIGNFVRDALAAAPIIVAGDGTPIRTYMYAADMTSWLWRLLVRGETCRAYNVGSERVISIEDTARLVAGSVEPALAVERRGSPLAGRLAERYACATQRARSELDLTEWTPLEDAVRCTIAWHRARP